jgi:hypothetical protein
MGDIELDVLRMAGVTGSMLAENHRALEQLLRELGMVPAEVEICYEMPTREWVDSRTRPTINLFLFDIKENRQKRETNLQTTRGSGRAERRLPPRRIDLYYMVNVFATERQDEHELLWRVLATLLKYHELPGEVLPDSLRHLAPTLTARFDDEAEGSRMLQLWNALGTPPHPALCYVVTAPLDLDIALDVPLVLTRTARYRSLAADGTVHATRIQIGGVVRDRNGNPLAEVGVRLADSAAEGSVTGADGQFVLRGVPSGTVKLNLVDKGRVARQVEVTVPADSYELVLDTENVSG